ncbi:hypothetical protein CVT25_001682 [Psilocybe cyanescens]|uniref:Uncharacterized protein n=1 Tax=Psilocybe cyanescens TaxID=93625 RepID=A0A409X5A9_PSICY|nr:hypothetical protein CVT25_001682 [Psilocybe cyanescens]
MPCPTSPNQVAIDQSQFWDENGMHWDSHRIGWAIAGVCAALAVTLSAFLLLVIEYVASTASGHSAEKALERKDKQPLPMPFCCWRYRPTKAYFMYTVKWSVLQYVIIRPAASIAGIICEKYDVLCEADGYSIHYAAVYIEAINFVSISVALYGLLMFYGLVHEELEGKRPLAKFLAIKLIVMFTFYQSFMIKALHGQIHATAYWTATNIANGLTALATCVEMVFFAILMWWAYSVNEYRRKEGTPATSVWRPLWDSINLADFAMEIFSSFRFFGNHIRRKPHTHDHMHQIPTYMGQPTKMDFGQAFGVSSSTNLTSPSQPMFERDAADIEADNIMLRPYPFAPQTRT